MRTLRFIVDDQLIRKDPDWDFDGLVPGTCGYLKAEFIFSPAWDNCVKVVEFVGWGQSGSVLSDPVILKDGRSCYIPSEVLLGDLFRLRLTGARGKEYRITTSTIEVQQNGGMR